MHEINDSKNNNNNNNNNKQCSIKVTFGRVRASILLWKSKNITYYDCMFVALGTQHASGMRRIVICGMSVSTILFDISQMARLSEKKVIANKMYSLFYLQFSSVTVLIPKRNEVPLYMYIGFHEKHPLFL